MNTIPARNSFLNSHQLHSQATMPQSNGKPIIKTETFKHQKQKQKNMKRAE